MCNYCKRFGKGTKWYLNPENYSEEMLKSERVQRDQKDNIGFKGSMVGILAGPERQSFEEGMAAMSDMILPDIRNKETVKSLNRRLENSHGGQVIPLKDAFKVIDLARGSIEVEECYCRKYFGGEGKFTCVWLYPVSEEVFTQRPWEEHIKISKEEAKKLMAEFDTEGIYHIIVWAPVPYPVVICNCDPLYCTAYKARMNYGATNAVLKGEYVAMVSHEKCDGCKEEATPKCLARCHFGAMKFSPTSRKAFVNIQSCFGCGLCRGVCHAGAIKLVERTSISCVMGVW